MRPAFRLAAIALAFATAAAAQSAPIPDPDPPQVGVTGEPGGDIACYWVFAESSEPISGIPSPFANGVRNVATALSKPATVVLPRNLGSGGKVVLRVRPVPGAVRYYVLKTTAIPAPSATVQVRKPGSGALYYWVVAHNGWRRSPVGGPFVAANTDASAPDNVITLKPVPGATSYTVYVTQTPDPPLGRGYYGVAEMVKETTVTHSGAPAHVPAGFPATPASEPPRDLGLYLLGVTGGEAVEDTSQPLQLILPPTVNETKQTTLRIPRDGIGSPRNALGSLIGIRAVGPAYAPEPSFAWTGLYPIWMETTINSGGINHYQSPPGGGGNYKSTVGTAAMHLTSRTQTQIANLSGYLTSYGMGDTIWLTPQVTIYGGVRDQGDEGTQVLRAHIERYAKEERAVVSADAPRGSTRVSVDAVPDAIGAGRTVINLTQSHSYGRIEYVDNCNAYGLGTQWTKQMEGRWISFDVDNQPGTGVRQWYQVDEVISPIHLRFRALTTWSSHCNLGFSRFIHDAKTGKGPGAYYTNKLANMTLPRDRVAAAEEGKYVIAPGTELADPYAQDGALNVEPLREEWHKGDRLVVAAGPQSHNQNIFCATFGSYMPQDVIMGIEVANFGDITANGPGVHIGSEPETAGWATGLLVTLPNSGMGNGIEINGTKTRYSAIVVPTDIPVLRANDGSVPYLQMSSATNALEVRKGDRVAAAFGLGEVQVAQPLRALGGLLLSEGAAITGSDRVRGKALFSGNGRQTRFTITFAKPFDSEPFVQITTNQFARWRLAEVTRELCVVEFESAPPAGENNVTVWWLAVQ